MKRRDSNGSEVQLRGALKVNIEALLCVLLYWHSLPQPSENKARILTFAPDIAGYGSEKEHKWTSKGLMACLQYMMGVSENRGLVVYHSSLIEMTIWEYTVYPIFNYPSTFKNPLGVKSHTQWLPCSATAQRSPENSPKASTASLRSARSPLAYSRPG